MKKILSLTMLTAVALGFTACNSEEDDLFSRSAAERLMDSQQAYTERFAATSAGWSMEFYPTNGSSAPKGKGYLMLVDFNTDGSVRIAMQNEMTDDVYTEDTSLWEVIADQGPVLSFNSRNDCLHLFSDPGIYDTGLGFEGDYEFQVLSLDENATYAMLKGKKRGTYVRLTRLDDGTDFEEYFRELTTFQNTVFNSSAPNDCLLQIGDSTFVVTNASSGIIDIYPLGGDAITETTSHPFLMTRHDGQYYLRFRDELTVGDATVQELVYDSDQQLFTDVEPSSNAIKGWPAEQFFMEYLSDGNAWKLTENSEMSDKFRTYIDALKAGFSKLKSNKGKAYGFVGLNLQYNTRNESFQWLVRYTPGTTSATFCGYDYELALSDSELSCTYTGPSADAKGSTASSTSVRNTLPSVADITDVLSQTFVISANDTEFDLSKIRLTAAADPDLWFVVNI